MLKNLKLKKVIKSFVSQPISCFSDSYVYEHLWTFSISVDICLFHVSVSCSYIFGPICYNRNIYYQIEISTLSPVIMIIIMSHHQHGSPCPSHAAPHYGPLLPAGPQGYISYRHRAAVCRFELVVLPLLVHVKGSTGVHYFSSSVSLVWFV